MTSQQLREALAYGCTDYAQAKRWLEAQEKAERTAMLLDMARQQQEDDLASWYYR